MSRIPVPCVCLVTDRRLLTPGARTPAAEVLALERWLDEAIEADIDLLQIRERDLDTALLRPLVARVAERAARGGPQILVNDRSDVARVAHASGVHLRADGPPIDRVRAFGPVHWIVGRSVHTIEVLSALGSADYVLFGTVFPSASKPLDAPAQGTDRLRAAIEASAVPVLAIGGIDPERAARCAAVGAAGVAAISLFLPEGRAAGARGVRRAAQELREALTRPASP
jgi:thiamine-phosphate pyrophosphorylase